MGTQTNLRRLKSSRRAKRCKRSALGQEIRRAVSSPGYGQDSCRERYKDLLKALKEKITLRGKEAVGGNGSGTTGHWKDRPVTEENRAFSPAAKNRSGGDLEGEWKRGGSHQPVGNVH